MDFKQITNQFWKKNKNVEQTPSAENGLKSNIPLLLYTVIYPTVQ